MASCSNTYQPYIRGFEVGDDTGHVDVALATRAVHPVPGCFGIGEFAVLDAEGEGGVNVFGWAWAMRPGA